MADIMLKLGDYKFSLDTAAYDEFRRSAEYLWAEQNRIGTHPALQFTGVASQTVNVRGKIYPQFRGGIGQVESMRSVAGNGEPLLLVAGTGDILGRWVIKRVSETQRVFFSDSVPRAIDFEMELKFYDNGNEV